MKMKRVVSLLVVAVIVAALRADARACKRLGPIPHVVDPSLQETDHTPPTLLINRQPLIDYGDSSPGGCGSDCPDIATIQIWVAATDDMTAPERIGYRFTLEAGELPPGLTLPDAGVEPNAPDAVVLDWNGTTGRPVDFTVQIVAIDRAGNESAPQSQPIRPKTAMACAVARGDTARPGLIAWLALMVAAGVRRRGRR